MNIFIFLSLAFIIIFLVGIFLERINIPWIFSALLFGILLAVINPFQDITSSPVFNFLANLGMYFLLFIIGFEIDLDKIKKQKWFIFRSAFFIIFFEAILGSLLIHFVFHYSWFISFIVALSFATVGEAILIPILDEFKIVNTRLGQAIIGIGTLDDILEILVLILVIIFIGSSNTSDGFNVLAILFSLFGLFAFSFGLSKLKKEGRKFKVLKVETLFLFVIAILFLFLGIGKYAEASALGAILSGIALKTFLPKERLEMLKNEVRGVCYGLFAPIFFLWAGLSIDIKYLLSYPGLILLVILVSGGAKYLGSLIMGIKEIGFKQSILLGTGLSVRFSTSIIIIKILLEAKLINDDIYSVIMASSIIFSFAIPILFSQLLRVYKIKPQVSSK